MMNEAPSIDSAGKIAFTQHCGLLSQQQQDALLVGGDIHQSPNLPARLLVIEGTSGLCALADGVASSPCPQRARPAVLEALNTMDSRQETWLQDGWIGPRLIRRHVHAQLCQQLARDRRTRGAASTLALLQWRGNRCSLVNVGDSRVYRIDRDGRWERRSRDHTYFESMVERGEIARDQSVGQLYHDLEHMLMADEEEDAFAVHWRQLDSAPGGTFLLCTDGLHDTLGEAQLAALYRSERPLREQAAAYREAVLHAGAPDNVSLILVRLAVSDALSNTV